MTTMRNLNLDFIFSISKNFKLIKFDRNLTYDFIILYSFQSVKVPITHAYVSKGITGIEKLIGIESIG
jgi:hypothetical protein